MISKKLEKIYGDIERTKSRINELRAKLRVLEKQRKDIEDEEIITVVRSTVISDMQLNEFRRELRESGKVVVPARQEKEEPHNASKKEN